VPTAWVEERKKADAGAGKIPLKSVLGDLLRPVLD